MKKLTPLLLLALCADPALAATPPYDSPDPTQLTAPGTSIWGVVVAAATGSTTILPLIDGGSTPACIPYGSVLIGTALTEVSLHLTESADGFAIGDPATDAECSVAIDGGSAAAGGCHVLAKGPFVIEVDRRVVHRTPGNVSGMCSSSIASASRVVADVASIPMCDEDSDCTGAGVSGGTCVASGSYSANQLEYGCAFVAVRALTAAGKLAVRVER